MRIMLGRVIHPRQGFTTEPTWLRAWRGAMLLIAALIAVAIVESLTPLHGTIAAVPAGVFCGGLVAAFAIRGSVVLAWLREHPILTALLLGSATYFTLLSLRVFTPLEDVVVGGVAGIALAALIFSETGDRRSTLSVF